jgi:DNA-binding NarL/FixJ family response regulator
MAITPQGDKPSLIIIDDNSTFRYALARTLAAHYEILATAGDGGAGISAVDEHQPDVVLMDISICLS